MVVGAPTYSPDGTRVAFSAMPSDGSSGPDIYVWSPGDQEAEPITTDHDSWLAGWAASGILASRVDAGIPSTYQLDPETGHALPIGTPGTWLPAVSPSGTAAGWWSGTVKLAADGVSWVPDQGRLVVGPWPSTADPAAAPQVLAKGPLDAWQVRWDDTGAVVAAWVAQGGGPNGRLSLYRVDEVTGAPDVASPMLDGAPAEPDFSLRAGRVAWTPPQHGPRQTVEVLAWSGKTVYPPMELPTDGSGTVVP